MSNVDAIRPAHRSRPGLASDDGIADFIEVRPRLLAVAYRIVGSWAEAEDVVQDAWIRWQGYDRDIVDSPTAFLVATTARLAINCTASARVRREAPVGQWFPEPVDPADDLGLGAERHEALEQGTVLLLERLSPVERAAYVLRQAFDYPYRRISELLHVSEVNARQLVSRARRRLTVEGGRPVADAERRRFVLAFAVASRHGTVRHLEDLLVSAVVPITGDDAVARAA